MTIIHINTSDRWGGAESSALNLYIKTKQAGMSSLFVVGRKFTDMPDIIEIPPDLGRTKWWKIWSKLINNCEQKIFRNLTKIARAIQEPGKYFHKYLGREYFNYPNSSFLFTLLSDESDIFHFHNLHGDYFDLRLLPILSRAAPTILNLRDTWLLTGHCAHNFDCERWQIGCGKCPYLSTYPAVKRDATNLNWRTKRKIFQKSKVYVTTVSKWLLDMVERSYIRPALAKVIYNGIDESIFSPGIKSESRYKLGLPEDKQILLFIGHSEFKDFSTFANAVRKLQADQKYSLSIVFLGRQLSPGFEDLPIRFCGFENDMDKLANYYRAADIFVHIAKAEAFGKTIIESMACETPVIASAVGGIPEIVENWNNGILIEANNPILLASSIENLLTHEDLRKKLGETGRNTVLKKFTLDIQLSTFVDWYQEVLDDWNSSNQNA